ncbi:MAG: SDR family NAD(P)-dependent oxidoreductase [Gammaproteobacteria bacterium]|nr:SDR family NAD(P)-dependent oxidoreductase [Gammaproteobacteria bacterium]
MKLQKVIIIGATSAIAQHCARRWAATPSEFLLVGRDTARLEQAAQDLRVRSPGSIVSTEVVDFLDAGAIGQLVTRCAAGGPIDIALIAHGTLPDQGRLQVDLAGCSHALALNGISPALFMEAFAAHMERSKGGRLVVIGSVAGDRGRKSNYVYGAAKGMLERYVQGLQHRLAGSGVRVSLVKPGPTATPMTSGLDGVGVTLAKVEDVAAAIVRGVKRGKPVIYAPGKWLVIMLVIRHLPRFIFNKLDI